MKTFKVNYVMDFCGNKTRKSRVIKANSEAEANKIVEQAIQELIDSNPGIFSKDNFYVD